MKTGSLVEILKHPDELIPLVKLMMMAKRKKGKRIIREPHWEFCYTMLEKVSRSLALVNQLMLPPEFRDPMCVIYLLLRAIDTVEDDTSIPTDIRVPVLKAFHQHIYDRDWHFSCGKNHYKVLMDGLHHVSTAFMELETRDQHAIKDICMKMGAGMSKFICKEVDTVDDYDEYCNYTFGFIATSLSKLLPADELGKLGTDALSDSMGLFLQKTNHIRDYLEDINEIPKARMIWPREIWSKYVDKLEDLKHENNSVKAVECLNDMVTNALLHVEDCLQYMSNMQDSVVFQFFAIPEVMGIGTLALCYNNINVFRGVVKMRRGLTAKVVDRTKSMSDVYGAFYDFSCMIKAKVNKNDPNATKTLSTIEAIQKVCTDSETLKKRGFYITDCSKTNSASMFLLVIAISVIFAYVLANHNSQHRFL